MLGYTSETLAGPSLLANKATPIGEVVGEKIPRPPNSWIIYRSEMSSALAAANPGSAHSQADISKVISRMWKEAPQEVKDAYERQAEMKKLEHARLYPNYRYNPKSKAEKDREREERKQMKAEGRRSLKRPRTSAAPTSQNGVPAQRSNPSPKNTPLTNLPFPLTTVHAAFSQYGPAGPSPPLSAANSPSPNASLQYTHISASSDVALESGNALDPSLATPGASNAYSHYQSFSEHSPRPVQLPDQQTKVPKNPNSHQRISERRSRHEPQYNVARRHHQQQQQQPYQVDQEELYPPQLSLDPSLPEGEGSGFLQEQPPCDAAVMNNTIDDTFFFNLPSVAEQNMEMWALQNPEFQPSLSHFLANTGSDNCFQVQMDPTNQHSLGDEPVGPLEVEMGQMVSQTALGPEAYDFSALQQWDFGQAWASSGAEVNPFSSLLSPLGGGFENTVTPPSHSLETSNPTTDLTPATIDEAFAFDQLFNFDPVFECTPETPTVESQGEHIPPPTPYKPPSGAALSSTRRVAASWKPSFAINDAIDV